VFIDYGACIDVHLSFERKRALQTALGTKQRHDPKIQRMTGRRRGKTRAASYVW